MLTIYDHFSDRSTVIPVRTTCGSVPYRGLWIGVFGRLDVGMSTTISARRLSYADIVWLCASDRNRQPVVLLARFHVYLSCIVNGSVSYTLIL